MKNRLARVNEVIKRELGMILTREMRFDAPLVTVQSVDITPDLRHCHVYISVLGEPVQHLRAVEKLEQHRGELQALMMKRITLKYTPHLHFKLDSSIERGTRILEIMNEVDQITPPGSEDDAPEQNLDSTLSEEKPKHDDASPTQPSL